MRQGLLLKQLVRKEMRSSQDISEYINEFNKIVERLEETGIEFSKRLSGLFFLNSLPSEYETICVAIKSREKFPSLEELKIKLIEEQMRIKDKFAENRSESEEALVATKRDVQQSQRKTYPSIDNKYKGKDRKCYICEKIGHFARNCKQSDKINPTKNNQNKTMLSIALNTVANSPSSWCLDSGATRRISNDKNKFVDLETNNTPICTATEDCTQASESGVVKFETLGLKNECPQWFKHGYKVEFNKRGAVVTRQDGKIIMKATLKDGIENETETETEKENSKNGEESLESEVVEESEKENRDVSKRHGRGQPRLIKTGKPGMPKKSYVEKEIKIPKSPSEAMTLPEKYF
ncbi:hypothetical protein M0802_015266 [Mischocyttarus mexicanus]|nr:hypothetical protein M0802_015266 [Mischocyttarus mexicanus]